MSLKRHINIIFGNIQVSGKVEGIKGNVDLNIITDDYLIKKSNEKEETNLYNVALEVLQGKHGNGKDRKKSLGNIYDAVQSLVNKIVYNNQMIKNEIVATEVIKGLWGNGNDRKERLTKAGYNYETIQKIVNERLKK